MVLNRDIAMKDRAITNEQKREVIESLYALWIKNPELRLGQLIWNGMKEHDLFFEEDECFVEILKEYYKG